MAAGTSPAGLFLLTSAGYGYSGSVLGVGDSHHRAMGALGVQARPVPWLALGLTLDGRYDRHLVPGQPADHGVVGDPRIFLRVDRALGDAVRFGARLGLWLPGGDAPSLSLGAATPDLLAALTYAFSSIPLWLSANGGYRRDRSVHSVGNAPLLSPSDRTGLGVSAFDQALVRVGATYGRRNLQGFLEASGDLLVGPGHPSLTESPLRVGVGARMAPSERLRLEAMLEILASGRPDTGPTAPLVPLPPRASVWVALVYRAWAPPPAPTRSTATARVPDPTLSAPAGEPAAPRRSPAAPAVITLEGVARSQTGEALTDLRVTIDVGTASLPIAVDADGAFTISGKVGDRVNLRAEATGHEPATGAFSLEAGATETATLTLRKRMPSGTLRGLVRSLDGRPLDAQIRIASPGRDLRTQHGHFELVVPPGWYEITVTAQGHRTQKRRVQVEDNGVTLLNLDMRGEK